jgi:hypothetical protein
VKRVSEVNSELSHLHSCVHSWVSGVNVVNRLSEMIVSWAATRS